MKVFDLLIYARACAYNEARLVAAEDGTESKVFSAFLVGIFDAPLVIFFCWSWIRFFLGRGLLENYSLQALQARLVLRLLSLFLR